MGYSNNKKPIANMNIYDALKKYAEKNKQDSSPNETQEQDEELDEYGRDRYGIYRNEYTDRTYNQMCRDAASLYEDAFDGDSEAELNID